LNLNISSECNYVCIHAVNPKVNAVVCTLNVAKGRSIFTLTQKQ